MPPTVIRHLPLALVATLLLSLCATPSLAGQDFQLHVEARLAPPPTTRPSRHAAATQPHAAPQWSTDLSVSLDQPFSATFVDGHTTTSLHGTVHKDINKQFRIAISVSRVTTDDLRPGETIPIVNKESCKSTCVVELSEENCLMGLYNAGAPTGPTTFLTLSPTPANP